MLSRVPVTSLTMTWNISLGSGKMRESCPLPRLWLDEEPRSLGEELVFVSLPQIGFNNCLCLSLEQSEVWKTQNPHLL